MRITHRTIASTGLILTLFGAPALAQTHPCDQQTTSTQVIQSGAPHKVTWCSPASDNLQALVVYVDGQAYDLLAVTPLTAPSASGMVQYESPLFLQVSRGEHTLEAATYNRNQLSGQLQLGPKSGPFVFAAVDVTPLTTAPVIKGVSR
jgi:hypothetical protein